MTSEAGNEFETKYNDRFRKIREAAAAAINSVVFVVVRNVVGHNFLFRLVDWYLPYNCPYRSGSGLFPKSFALRCGTRSICKNAALSLGPARRSKSGV